MSFYENIYRVVARPLRALFRVRVTGAEKLPQDTGCLLCANHMGFLDVLIISAGLNRQVRYMAKKDLFKIPLLGPLITALGAFPVDRRASTDVGAIRKTIRFIEEGQLVGIFPQGKRYAKVNPRSTPLKHGVGMIVYRAKCPVTPVFIKTNGNKVRFFRKTELIVGTPLSYDELGFADGGIREYQAATEKIFGTICDLGDCPPAEEEAAK